MAFQKTITQVNGVASSYWRLTHFNYNAHKDQLIAAFTGYVSKDIRDTETNDNVAEIRSGQVISNVLPWNKAGNLSLAEIYTAVKASEAFPFSDAVDA